LRRSVPAPTAVLKLPSVSLLSENQPTAVFAMPVVMLKRVWSPSAVLNPAKAVSGAAGVFGKSAKQLKAKAIRIDRSVLN
jgi:hypothetical protein